MKPEHETKSLREQRWHDADTLLKQALLLFGGGVWFGLRGETEGMHAGFLASAILALVTYFKQREAVLTKEE